MCGFRYTVVLLSPAIRLLLSHFNVMTLKHHNIMLRQQQAMPTSYETLDRAERLKTIKGEERDETGLRLQGNFGEEHGAEFLEFLVTHAGDAGEGLLARWAVTRHVAEGHIREDDVGRDV